ncbi:hypothetical protein B0A48_00138 [Cryoendolithus antarcticus]|uniref:Uncharacterized protein n=1 Tax=Cryoendolithus antarcticus TaxID=1507870 RepID=A0A1V8TTS0_9PEZI|nr:hypothetical protein B0A48_00138 [Cryoendolithus antarcticus]
MPPHSQRPEFATRENIDSPATGTNAIPQGRRDRTSTRDEEEIRDRQARSAAPSPSSSLADALVEHDAEAVAAALALVALSKCEEGRHSNISNGTGTEGKSSESVEADSQSWRPFRGLKYSALS